MPAETETANPGPLGLVGFGLTTVLLSFINAGVLTATNATAVVIPLAIAFGGTIQLFAGLLEYGEGNTFGTVAFCSYGAFWWWFGLMELFAANGLISLEGATPTIGVALILWGIFTAYMWVATFRLNWALWSVFLLLTVTFFLLGFGDVLGIGVLVVAGGYVGIVTGLDAMYVSFAEVTNWAFDDEVLPLGGVPLEPSGAGSDESVTPGD